MEHYANCCRLHAVTCGELRLPRATSPEDRLAAFLGLDFRASDPPAVAVRVAIRMSAAYRAHCVCRHRHLRQGVAAEEALRQFCREAVRGQREAGRIYDACQEWA